MAAPGKPPTAKKISTDDFLFGAVLGEGAYAKVVYARSRAEEGREFAVKVLDKRFMAREKKTHFVMMERNVMMRVRHPNIVRLMYTFQDKENLFFAMDLCRGGELSRVIRDTHTHTHTHTHSDPAANGIAEPAPERPVNGSQASSAALSPAHIRFLLAQTVSACAHLHTHTHVVHRDLKPENILLTADGHVKLGDFGTALDEAAVLAAQAGSEGGDAASHTHAHTHTHTSRSVEVAAAEDTFVGSAEYVSPEVLAGTGAHAPADLWAAGCVLYACLTGSPPFHGASDYLTFQQILGFDDAATRRYWGVHDGAGTSGSDADADDAVRPAWLFGTGVVTDPAAAAPPAANAADPAAPDVAEPRRASVMGGGEHVRSLILRFPRGCDPPARDLVLQWLRHDPYARLGVVRETADGAGEGERCGPVLLDYRRVRAHAFFNTIDWSTISDPRKTKAPWVPTIQPMPEPMPLGPGGFGLDADLAELGMQLASSSKSAVPTAPMRSTAASPDAAVIDAARSRSEPPGGANGSHTTTSTPVLAGHTGDEVAPLDVGRSASDTKAGVAAAASTPFTPRNFPGTLSSFWSSLTSTVSSVQHPAAQHARPPSADASSLSTSPPGSDAASRALSTSAPTSSGWLSSSVSDWNMFKGSQPTPGVPPPPAPAAASARSTSSNAVPAQPPTALTPALPVVTPMILPKGPPQSPLPEVLLYEGGDETAVSSPSVALRVIDEYIAAPAPAFSMVPSRPVPAAALSAAAPAPTQTLAAAAATQQVPGEVAGDPGLTSATAATPTVGGSATATPSSASAAPVHDSGIPANAYWAHLVDTAHGESVVLAGSVKKRRGFALLPVLHFTPPERDIVITRGHPSGARVLYLHPTSKHLRATWNVREDDVRVVVPTAPAAVQAAHTHADAASCACPPEQQHLHSCDFELIAHGSAIQLCDSAGASRWIKALEDARASGV